MEEYLRHLFVISSSSHFFNKTEFEQCIFKNMMQLWQFYFTLACVFQTEVALGPDFLGDALKRDETSKVHFAGSTINPCEIDFRPIYLQQCF